MNKFGYNIHWAIYARSKNDIIYDLQGQIFSLPFKESINWVKSENGGWEIHHADIPLWAEAGGHENMNKEERKLIEHKYRNYIYKLYHPTQEEAAEEWARQQYNKNR